MDFELSFEKRPKYLFVKGRGTRKNLQAVFDSATTLTKIIEDNKARYILLDYSTVITHSSNVDVFNITRLYETKPVFSHLCVSCIVNPDEVTLDKFWEDVSNKRGYNFKIFTDPGEAEAWLLKEIDKVG
jgi:hypothetical protein